LKLLHVLSVQGLSVDGLRLASLSCSGGEASLVADLGETCGLQFPPLTAPVRERLQQVLGDQVSLANPLDYQTYIWADQDRLTACFSAMLTGPVDAALLVLDFPSPDGTELAAGWRESMQAFIAAQAEPGHARVPALVVSSMPELMPPAAAQALLAAGIAPMQGLGPALRALRGAARWATHRAARPAPSVLAERLPPLCGSGHRLLTEVQAKQALAACGLSVPAGQPVSSADAAVRVAAALGGPVVVKAVSPTLAHKSELGAVRLNLRTPQEVRAAVEALAAGPQGFNQFLVEAMAQGTVAELIIGLTRDAQFGHQLTLGAGGVLVELLADSVSLLLPASRAELAAALRRLRCHALLEGWRGAPAGDTEAVLDAIEAVLRYAAQQADRLIELDINPLIVLPRGAVAVDALVRLAEPGPSHPGP